MEQPTVIVSLANKRKKDRITRSIKIEKDQKGYLTIIRAEGIADVVYLPDQWEKIERELKE